MSFLTDLVCSLDFRDILRSSTILLHFLLNLFSYMTLTLSKYSSHNNPQRWWRITTSLLFCIKVHLKTRTVKKSESTLAGFFTWNCEPKHRFRLHMTGVCPAHAHMWKPDQKPGSLSTETLLFSRRSLSATRFLYSSTAITETRFVVYSTLRNQLTERWL